MSATSVLRHAQIALPRFTVRGFVERLVTFDARYRNRMDLKALDDHMLRDIGLTHADVDSELRRPLPW